MRQPQQLAARQNRFTTQLLLPTLLILILILILLSFVKEFELFEAGLLQTHAGSVKWFTPFQD